MASNLNKAFMRAYAKDRSAPTDNPAPAAAMPASPVAAVTTPVVMPTPTPATPVSAAASSQSTSPSRLNPVASVAQPSMEPTVFAGRYASPQVVQAPPAAARVSAAPPPARPAAPTPTANTHRIPAPSLQTNAGSQPMAGTPVTNVTPTARVVTAPPRAAVQPPMQQPSSTRVETVARSENGEAARVWQRIDAAHGSQAVHPTTTQARPTVSAAATRTTAPKRMQAAAAPAPVAPPIPASPLRVDTPTQPGARHLPLVGDEINPNSDAQPSETRRRTVADFLYAAGQYNPGRVLASAETADVSMTSAAATTVAPMRSSEMVRSMDAISDSAVMNHQSMSAPLASPAAMPEQPYAAPAMDEPMPRRMGQILRVDVPRGQSASAAMPAAPAAAPRQPQPTMPTAAPTSAVQSSMPQPMAVQSMPSAAPMPSSAPPATAQPASAQSLDAPVAKYVLEQRRMDRAHKLNEAEDKLRRNTHKIFNPVWEVDNLQWPVVVDKLMQQRAQSMSHVAEHMKAACQDGLSVLGVTSAGQGEGRTTVACCLARLAAAHGLNVALVDIDLDHPTLCVQTNMEVEHDWRDCLSEDVSLEEVAVHSIDDQLTVLPLKPRGGRPGLLASDSRIADILADLSESFELVIVDCSKTSSSGNVITGLAHTKIFDAAIVVVDRRDSEADRVEDALRMIQQTGIESIGIVDNFSM